jgi:RNA polymerase sigma-70 factor (ECF subfamily)
LLLKQIVLTMPVAYVFVLSRFAGLTYDEIALRLNLSVMTLEWRMSKALLHCKHMLRTED